jgi:hypothetical protein
MESDLTKVTQLVHGQGPSPCPDTLLYRPGPPPPEHVRSHPLHPVPLTHHYHLPLRLRIRADSGRGLASCDTKKLISTQGQVTVPKGIVNLDTLAGARGQIKVLAFEFQVRLGFPAGVQRLDKDLAHSSKVRAVAGKGVQRSAWGGWAEGQRSGCWV